MLNRIFKLSDAGTTVRTEVMAGITTFMTMAYIIFVNPAILSNAGVPFAGAATATALGAAIMCIAMGMATNRPLAMASGMGFNAALTFSVIGFHQANVPWQVGMAIVFAEGVIIFILVMSGLREAIMHAIPHNLKRAIGVGIGIFITVIGLVEGGIIRPAPVTIVALGDFTQKYVWVTLIGVGAILVCMTMRIKGSIFWGIIMAAIAGLLLNIIKPPSAFLGSPDFSTCWAPFQVVNGRMAILSIFTPVLLVALFSLMLTDFFDTMGTVVAVGEQAGFVDADGKIKNIRPILAVDSVGAAAGGLFGASSITTYIESAAGVADGGRTGLMSVVTGLLFILAAFFAPVIAMIGGGYRIPNAEQYILLAKSGFMPPADMIPPAGAGDHFAYPVTAGALIIVGFLMMRIIREIPWGDFEESFPAFLTILGIPLTYNISYGIGFGFISHVVIKLLNGKWRQVHPLMYIVSILFVAVFIEPLISKILAN